MKDIRDVLIIGGGQSGLACGYYLKRAKLDFLILDQNEECGGSWLNTWDSLTLFSPSEHSSLPGWLMPKSENIYPSRQEVISYLCDYERHYQLNIQRSTRVENVIFENNLYKVITNKGSYYAKTIIAAAGTWNNPFIPKIKGLESFEGIQIHSANYKNAESFRDLKVLVVGEGNSGAQIVAEISKITTVKWSTRRKPEYLPDEVDGYYLFNVATAKFKAEQQGKPFDASAYNLGNIVMVPAVKEARSRGVLISSGTFDSFYTNGVLWSDGRKEEFEAVIWCTGFNYATSFLRTIISLDEKGIAKTLESKAMESPGLWLVGYGNWTGYASATLIGLNRNTKLAVAEIVSYLNRNKEV